MWFWVVVRYACSFCRRSRSFCGDCMRSFLACAGSGEGSGEGTGLAPLIVLMVLDLGFLPGWGEGLTMLAVPGRSERADLVGGVLCCGEPVLGASMGIPELACWRAEMVTSSLPELFGRLSVALNALAGPGEFSFLNEEGSLDRSGSLVGDVCLTLPPRDDDGVDGRGEFGRDLSKLAPVIAGTLRKAGGDIGCCEGTGKSSSSKSESELRLFFLGGPVGMKLGCSPMVVSPFDPEPGDIARSS